MKQKLNIDQGKIRKKDGIIVSVLFDRVLSEKEIMKAYKETEKINDKLKNKYDDSRI